MEPRSNGPDDQEVVPIQLSLIRLDRETKRIPSGWLRVGFSSIKPVFLMRTAVRAFAKPARGDNPFPGGPAKKAG
jgi:hypothetical protein